MKRGRPWKIKSTERDYRVRDAAHRPIPGAFTRDEAIAKAKELEAWMKEQGFPRGTKHYVIYQPTGEDVPFDGARARRRQSRLGGAQVDRKLRSFHEAIDDGNCSQALDDLVVSAVRKVPSTQLRQAISRFRGQCLRER